MNKIKRILQRGGDLFPDATSYKQLGASNQRKYLSPITYKKPRQWRKLYNTSRIMQDGGEIDIDVNRIYNTDLMHPSDSDRLSYKEPVGMAMKITNKMPIITSVSSGPSNLPFKHCNGLNGPFKRQSGGTLDEQSPGYNVAKTQSDYSEGLNKGKNVFQFPSKGLKKMTMNPPSGAIEYPIQMEGYTNNQLTDKQLVNPGEDAYVDGDTIVEKPDLSEFDFNNAIEYAMSNKLPIFVWNGIDFPLK